ncbi:hypothetical protein ACFC0N_28140 [Streptomyces zaomyceticus]|uniref:hypothetical protein n=1 Tax=Streptomyces zaomyceticus TaxID=68286 RepID=UPI0035D7FA57
MAEGEVRLGFVRGTPPPDGRGAVQARDRSGVLWRYEGTGDVRRPFATRERVGGGWNVHTAPAGTGELGRDDTPDLVARDTAGKLWLHQGVRKPGPEWNGALVPGPVRALVGGGWNTYDLIF